MTDDMILIDELSIKDKIYEIRGVKVMLDFDLAEIYGYSTSAFNQQVNRNIEKFDDDFRFQLSREEVYTLSISQNVTSIQTKGIRGGRSKPIFAFTESGIYMLMTILKGDLAVRQSKALIRTFRAMKDYIVENRPIAGQHELLQLSLQVNENRKDTEKIREELTQLGCQMSSVMDKLGNVVKRSEIAPFMLDFSRPEERKEYLFLDCQPMRSDLAFMEIYARAKKSIHIIDDYINMKTLHLLCEVSSDIQITIISDNLRGMLHKSDYMDCQKENPGFEVTFTRSMGISHDRFIILDHKTESERLFHCGPSSKDSGNRMSAILEFQDSDIVEVFSNKLSRLLENPPLVL